MSLIKETIAIEKQKKLQPMIDIEGNHFSRENKSEALESR